MITTEELEKVNSRPIDGVYPELAREVRRLLGFDRASSRPYLTSRMASRKTGVNHSTITTTIRGDRPSYETVLKLAAGLGGDADHLLSLAGYANAGGVFSAGGKEKGASDVAKDELGTVQMSDYGITYAPGWDALSDEHRRLVGETAQATAQAAASNMIRMISGAFTDVDDDGNPLSEAEIDKQPK